MGIAQNVCPGCQKIGGLTKVPQFDGQKLPGSFCKKCGLFIADRQNVSFDVSCGGCNKLMGRASIQIPVVHIRSVSGSDVIRDPEREVTVIHKGEKKKTYMCPDCSRKRIAEGKHDPDEVMTRHEGYCLGGCGKLQVLRDVPEGTELNEKVDCSYCPECTPTAREQAANDKQIDDLVKKISQ